MAKPPRPYSRPFPLIQALEAGKWAKAEEMLRKMIKTQQPHPEMLLDFGRVLNKLGKHEEAVKTLKRAAKKVIGIPAIHFETGLAAMLPLDVGWNDVGSWSSLWEVAPRDTHGNSVRGDALIEDSSNLYIPSERTLVAAIGLKDLVIVDTPDALLVDPPPLDRFGLDEVRRALLTGYVLVAAGNRYTSPSCA